MRRLLVLAVASVGSAACAVSGADPASLLRTMQQPQAVDNIVAKWRSKPTASVPTYRLLDQVGFCILAPCVEHARALAPVLTERYRDQYTTVVSGEVARLVVAEGAGVYRLSGVEYAAVRLLALLAYDSPTALAVEARRTILDLQRAEAADESLEVAALAPVAALAAAAVRDEEPEVARVLELAAARHGVAPVRAMTTGRPGVLVVGLLDLVPGLEESAQSLVWMDGDGVLHAINVVAPQVPPVPDAPRECVLGGPRASSLSMPLLADFSSMVRRDLERRVKALVARSLARSVGRAVAADQLGRSVSGGPHQGSVATRSVINLGLAATEVADLRGPAFVPRLVYAAVVDSASVTGATLRCATPLANRRFPVLDGRTRVATSFSVSTPFGARAHGQVHNHR